jgi:hypothetical protein
MTNLAALIVCLALHLQGASSWSVPSSQASLLGRTNIGSSQNQQPRPFRSLSVLNSAASATGIPAPEEAPTTTEEMTAVPAEVVETTSQLTKKEMLQKQALKEGGLFTFNTKYGALNPYAIYYGVTSIFLGLFWFVALTACEFFYFITRVRFDKRVSSASPDSSVALFVCDQLRYE